MEIKIFGFKIEKISKKNNVKKIKKLSIWLDDYEEIFSDFDPRPYSQRVLSDDFFNEIKKLSLEDLPHKIELNLILENIQRDKKLEKIIIDRINGYFEYRYKETIKKNNRILKQSALFLILGGLMITYIHYMHLKLGEYTLFLELIHPASWFLSWEALHLFVFEYLESKPFERFLGKVSNSKITFSMHK